MKTTEDRWLAEADYIEQWVRVRLSTMAMDDSVSVHAIVAGALRGALDAVKLRRDPAEGPLVERVYARARAARYEERTAADARFWNQVTDEKNQDRIR